MGTAKVVLKLEGLQDLPHGGLEHEWRCLGWRNREGQQGLWFEGTRAQAEKMKGETYRILDQANAEDRIAVCREHYFSLFPITEQ